MWNFGNWGLWYAGEGGEATGNFLAILRGVPALVYTFHRIYFSSGSLAIEICTSCGFQAISPTILRPQNPPPRHTLRSQYQRHSQAELPVSGLMAEYLHSCYSANAPSGCRQKEEGLLRHAPAFVPGLALVMSEHPECNNIYEYYICS